MSARNHAFEREYIYLTDPPSLNQGNRTLNEFCREVDALAESVTDRLHQQGKVVAGFLRGLNERKLKHKILEELKRLDYSKLGRRGKKYSITWTWKEVRKVCEDMGELAPIGAAGEDLEG